MNLSNIKLDASNLDEFLQELLRIIGNVLNVSRSYIFEYYEKTDTMDNTYEWTRPGIEPQKETLQNIPMQLNAYWQECMLKNQAIIFSDVRDIPSFPENQVLMEQNIESIIIVPIHINGKYYGFLGIDECSCQRIWTELEVDYMKAMAVFVRTLVDKFGNDSTNNT